MFQRIVQGHILICRGRLNGGYGYIQLEMNWQWVDSADFLDQEPAPWWINPFDEIPF